MNAFNFFLEGAARHSTVAAGNFYTADLPRGEEERSRMISLEENSRLTRESHRSSQVYKFRSILLVLVNSAENSFIINYNQ